MLSTLRIRRIGVIDDAMLDFGPGFTALTGETGAGKTMIVTGLTMLLGGRLDRGRTSGASTVDGTLSLTGHTELADALDELGAEEEDGEVLVVPASPATAAPGRRSAASPSPSAPCPVW